MIRELESESSISFYGWNAVGFDNRFVFRLSQFHIYRKNTVSTRPFGDTAFSAVRLKTYWKWLMRRLTDGNIEVGTEVGQEDGNGDARTYFGGKRWRHHK